MAKQYIKPLSQVVEIDTEQCLLATSTTNNIEVDNDNTTGEWD